MKNLLPVFLLFVLAAARTPLRAQTPLPFRDNSIKGPQTFAMVIGISKYRFIRPLTYADKDAQLFRDYLKSPGGGSLKDENIFLLMNEQATSGNFWSKGFQWLGAKQLQKGDRLFIYLAGHGDAIDEDQFFFLGYDCNPHGDKNNYLVGGAIQLYNLKKKIANETARGVEVFFIMDACRSNELPGGTAGQSFLNTAVSQKRAGEIMMLAAAAGQESLEDASIGNGHGLFTWYLVDGLSGLADSSGGPDNKVTFSEIQQYVDKNVPAIAQQRFRRSQDPFFCCNENSEKVISSVDPAYLQQWMKTRKSGGNSFNGEWDKPAADTQLVETYNRFYREIRNKHFSGTGSAESYYAQLDKKFPGNPYTLDAKSTLAAQMIDDAQAKVNNLLDCILPSSAKEKQESLDAGIRLEKAIDLIRDYQPEFANALQGRVYFLKSNGDYGNTNTAFLLAHAARKADRDAAYTNAWLARLHLNAGDKDSALYFAERAVKMTPNWPCALTTLALVQQAVDNRVTNKGKKPNPANHAGKSSIGVTLGGGINHSSPTFRTNPNATYIGASSQSTGMLDLGVTYHIPLSSAVSVRPAILYNYGVTEVRFQRRNVTGGPIITEIVPIKKSYAVVSLPLLVHFNGKKVIPYFTAGPALSLVLGNTTDDPLPLKRILFSGDAGFGIDFRIARTGMVLSPELKYSAGLGDIRDGAANTAYSNSLSNLKKQVFRAGVYLRWR